MESHTSSSAEPDSGGTPVFSAIGATDQDRSSSSPSLVFKQSMEYSGSLASSSSGSNNNNNNTDHNNHNSPDPASGSVPSSSKEAGGSASGSREASSAPPINSNGPILSERSEDMLGRTPEPDGNRPIPLSVTMSPSKSQSPLKMKGKSAAKIGKSIPKLPKRKAKWSGPFLWTDKRSSLKKADLRAMLLNPRAWHILSPEAKQSILAKLPNNKHVLNPGTENARPNTTLLSNDDNFRHDCARYTENLAAGRHDPEWLRQAWIAQKKHVRGDFDEFEVEEFREAWETELPQDESQQETKGAQVSGAKD